VGSAIKVVHTAPCPHRPNRMSLVTDHCNRLYDESASLRCDGKLFHSTGTAAANALPSKVLWSVDHVTTHAWLVVVWSGAAITHCDLQKTSILFLSQLSKMSMLKIISVRYTVMKIMKCQIKHVTSLINTTTDFEWIFLHRL